MSELRHEPPHEAARPKTETAEPASEQRPAAEARVTAEEFARAVARHQARREEAARRLEGTITLGEALQELEIEADPKDILAEVQAERARKAAATVSVTPLHRRQRNVTRVAFAAAAALLLLGGLLGVTTAPAPVHQVPPPTIVVERLPATVAVAAPGTTLVRDAGRSQGMLRTLAEVPDGRAVHCALAQAGGTIALTNFTIPETAWTLIKHDGRLYIRGWIADMTPAALQSTQVEIHRARASVRAGLTAVPVTIRLDQLRCVGGLSTDEMLLAENVQPDRHFREKR